MIKLTTLTISLILCCFLLDGVYGNGYNLNRRKNEILGEDPWWDDENEYLSGDDIIQRLPDVMDDDPRSRTERVDKDIKPSDNLLNKDNNYDGDWDDQTYENFEENGNRDIQEKSNFDDDGDWDYEQVKYESFKSDGKEDEKENFDDDLNLDVKQEDNDRWKEQELVYNNYEDNDNYDDYWAQQEYNNLEDDGWDDEQNFDTEDGNLENTNVDYGDYGEQNVYENDNLDNEDVENVGSWDRPIGVSNNLEEGRYKRQVSAVNSEKEGISDDFYFVESSMDDVGCIGTECSDEREDDVITSPERDGSFLDLGSDSSADYFIT